MEISVVIPTYNRAHLIGQAIESALAQKFENFEVIVIDDGSSDNTKDIVAGYGERVRYIPQENRGPNAARNNALRVSKAKYIALLDDDDLWHEFKLGLQHDILEKHPELAYVYSNFTVAKDDGRRIEGGITAWGTITDQWEKYFEYCEQYPLPQSEQHSGTSAFDLYIGNMYWHLLNDAHVLPSTALIRRSMIPQGVEFIEHDYICGDWDFFARLSKLRPCAFMNYDTTINRSHDAFRLTRTDKKEKYAKCVGLVERLWKSDAEFYAKFGDDVRKVLSQYHFIIGKLHLYDGERQKARKALSQAIASSTIKRTLQMTPYLFMANIPGSHNLLEATRRLMQR